MTGSSGRWSRSCHSASLRASAGVGGAPAIGTFPKDINHTTCRLFAQRAMQLNFVDVFTGFSGDWYSVVGVGSQNIHPGVTVIVVMLGMAAMRLAS